MKLRWLVLCDEHGVKTEPELQYWTGSHWEMVNYSEYKTWKYDEREDAPE